MLLTICKTVAASNMWSVELYGMAKYFLDSVGVRSMHIYA